MPIPLLAIAVRGAAMKAIVGGKDVDYREMIPELKFSWSQAGRGIKKARDRISKNVSKAAFRASRTTGRWARAQFRKELTALLNIRLKDIKTIEREWWSGPPKSRIYNLVYRRTEFRPSQLKRTRFRPYKGQGRNADFAVGRLRVTAYGQTQDFEGVIRKRTPRGDRFSFLRDSNRRGRRVRGTYVKQDYRGPLKVKKKIKRRWILEFRRQLKVLTAKS